MNQYWIVIGVKPAILPHRHMSLRAAHDEAVRLARVNRGIAFTVFQAVEINVSNDVATTTLKAPAEGDDIPF